MSFSIDVKRKTEQFLMDLISFPSTRGNEGQVNRFIFNSMKEIVDRCELVEINDDIINDPDYAFPIPDFTYANTPNLECVLNGDGEKTVIFNTHVDVVPASEGQEMAFSPKEENGIIWGRGACDAKGQVATLFALAQIFKEKKITPPGKIIFHFVVEEENGGNGTLAMIRRGVKADAAIILEPSELNVISSVRGAVWFTLRVFGKATHSGNVSGRISALDKAFEAINIFKLYHDELLLNSRGNPLFDVYEDPMPLTIGQCVAGTWPASVPAEAVLKGLIGFLPNKNRFQIQEELRNSLINHGDDWLRDNFELTFPMLNNDSNSIPEDHPLVTTLLNSVEKNGLKPKTRAMTASCDAWRYNNQANIPSVVFGPGSLGVAHSKDEHINLDDILLAAKILYDFCLDFGSKPK